MRIVITILALILIWCLIPTILHQSVRSRIALLWEEGISLIMILIVWLSPLLKSGMLFRASMLLLAGAFSIELLARSLITRGFWWGLVCLLGVLMMIYELRTKHRVGTVFQRWLERRLTPFLQRVARRRAMKTGGPAAGGPIIGPEE
jgi:polyferredoxin